MCDGMNWNGQRLAILTQVEVVACRMQTLEAASENGLLAYVAGGGVPHSMFRRDSEHDIMRIGYLDKDVVWVLLGSDPKAGYTTIIVGAVCTFESVATDPSVAQVTGRVVDRLLNGAAYVVNDDSAGL